MSGTISGAGGRGQAGAAAAQEPEVAKFHKLVNNDGIGGLDRNANLKTIAQDVHRLSGPQINATLDGLSTQDIREFGSNLNHGGIVGGQFGLSDGERRSVFHDLAAKAGGAQLAKLSRGLEGEDKARLADAVAHAPNATVKLDYIKALRPDLKQPGSDEGRSAAAGIGTVLSSLGHASADAGFNALDKDQLSAVMDAAYSRHIIPAQGTAFQIDNTTGVANLVGAAAGGSDPAMKARVFTTASAVTSGVQQAAERRKVADAQTKLLMSDTNGVVQALNVAQPGGRALAGYAKEVIQEEKGNANSHGPLGVMIARLQRGNDMHARDGFDYVSYNPSGKGQVPAYPRAANLGYFSGAVMAGINGITADAKSQASMLGNVLTGTLFALSAASTVIPATGATATTAGTLAYGGRIMTSPTVALSKQTIDNATNEVAQGNRSLKDAIFDQCLPRPGRNSHAAHSGQVGTLVEAVFRDSMSSVMELRN